ncbi:hypothetical protein [Streptomyces sp. NPDC017524]|uniref:hypothetical protein n=1 Tax=Streptomyces sp. NPDC017524 TaxID=3364999 RepID=UPI00379042AA
MILHGGGPRIDLSYDALEDAWRDAFLAAAQAGSALIVHFIGHGIKGAAEELYLPARDTKWVIAACSDGEKAYGARFSRATGTVLAHLKAGWLDLSPSASGPGRPARHA